MESIIDSPDGDPSGHNQVPEVWIGLFLVRPLPGNRQLDGPLGTSLGAFVKVSALARGKNDFVDRAKVMLSELEFVIESIEDVNTIQEELERLGPDPELQEFQSLAVEAGDPVLGPFHSFVSEDDE